MASGGTIDPKVMTITKGKSIQRMSFSEGLKNSSALKAWNDHEDRFVEFFRSMKNLGPDFEQLKEKQQDSSNLRYVLGNLYLKFMEIRDKFEKEFEFGLPMLKDRYHSARRELKTDLLKEIDQCLSNWTEVFPQFDGIKLLAKYAKSKEDFLKYCRAADHWYRIMDDFQAKAKNLQQLMIKGARATRIKSILPEVQVLKEKLEEILNQQRSFLQPFHQNFLKPKEEELEQAKLLLQEVTQDCLSYVEPLDPYVDETGAEFDVTFQNLDSKTIFSNPEEGLDELERGTTNPEESTKSGVVCSQLSKDNVNVSGASTEQKANETLQRGLKLLRDVNQSTVFDKNESRAEVAPRQTGSVTLSTAKRRTLVDLSPSRTLPKSDTYKPRGSNVGSDLSKASERRRLEMHANVLEQKSQMEIEKRLRELRLEKTKKQMEMSQKLFDLQAEAEIAEMESRKALEQHELRLQIEEAEGSFRPHSICPSLMSLVLDEDKNSDIKSWLEQSDENFDKCFSQPKESSREVENKGGSSALPQRLPEYSHQKNQQLPSQPRNRATSRSPQRKNPVITLPKPITSLQRGNDEPKPKHGFANTTFKVEHPFPSFTPAVPVHQPVQFLQTSLPKLKLSEFYGDPLEWPEWSSLFTATIHNAPIDDNAKMSHLKILVKGKAKAAIAGLGYSGVMYSAAWNVLVTNFGRPQTIVNAQMKQIHLSPFIKSHDSIAIIKYAQLFTTCVNVLKQFGFTGDLYSESVLNSALRKLPTELKTKWFFLSKSKSYYNADLCKFSEWLNEVAYVHDEMMVQFKTPFDKKATGSTEKVKTSTFVANDQGKTTSSSNKQCPL